MRGLIAARAAVLAAVVAIDGDIRRMVKVSDAYRPLMSIPGLANSPHSPSQLQLAILNASGGPVT
jgi:hypothetical protein